MMNTSRGRGKSGARRSKPTTKPIYTATRVREFQTPTFPDELVVAVRRLNSVSDGKVGVWNSVLLSDRRAQNDFKVESRITLRDTTRAIAFTVQRGTRKC